jgi:diketogulonate reductase-like aldo/keto reductase
MPQVGFGVFRIADEDVTAAVLNAFDCGYRHIDTASLYGNERGVGRAIERSGLAREEIFVTTKLWNDDHGIDRAPSALRASLDRLGLEYVDLYLIHWPKPSTNLFVETWNALEAMCAQGSARAIGVSNFQPHHLDTLSAHSDIVPAANQIELHPYFQQKELREYDTAHGIATVSWSPLGQARALHDPVINEIARRYDRTPAQVILRWQLDCGNVVIPKSTDPARMRENLCILDFALEEGDRARMRSLDAGLRWGPDPDEVETESKPGFSSNSGRWVERPG